MEGLGEFAAGGDFGLDGGEDVGDFFAVGDFLGDDSFVVFDERIFGLNFVVEE